MDIRTRLAQIEQVHAQHVQLLQQTQANIIRLEGAMDILKEVVAAEEQKVVAESAKVLEFPARKVKRTRRSKAQPLADAHDNEKNNGEAESAQPA